MSNYIFGNTFDMSVGDLPQHFPRHGVFVIADSFICQHYRWVTERFPVIKIDSGEQSKSWQTVDRVVGELLALGADRNSVIVGIGGGVVTDLAGFTASIYMRGVRFVAVPTTLLAQVDAAIGGKNGINVGGYKNIAGTFSMPETVVFDYSFLKTLPDREFRSGMAEVIKAGIIGDPELFKLLEQHSITELRTDDSLLEELIQRAVRVKCEIVERDPRESGDRKLLNLGHTFGHAIEHCSHGFSHGEAVAVGLCMAADRALLMGLCEAVTRDRIVAVVQKTGLPTTCDISMQQLEQAMKMDKKRSVAGIDFILPQEIGNCVIINIKS